MNIVAEGAQSLVFERVVRPLGTPIDPDLDPEDIVFPDEDNAANEAELHEGYSASIRLDNVGSVSNRERAEDDIVEVPVRHSCLRYTANSS